MRIFNLDENYQVVCNWHNTRNGFKHTANLCRNGNSVCETKVNYLNRTWESFEYETVLYRVVDCYFEGKEQEKYRKIIKDLRPY